MLMQTLIVTLSATWRCERKSLPWYSQDSPRLSNDTKRKEEHWGMGRNQRRLFLCRAFQVSFKRQKMKPLWFWPVKPCEHGVQRKICTLVNHSWTDLERNRRVFKRMVILTAYSVIMFMHSFVYPTNICGPWFWPQRERDKNDYYMITDSTEVCVCVGGVCVCVIGNF